MCPDLFLEESPCGPILLRPPPVNEQLVIAFWVIA